MAPTTRKESVAKSKSTVCVICGKAAVSTSSDSFYPFTLILESRTSMLEFLSSHDVVSVEWLGEKHLACNACTNLVKKTDRLQKAYEKSLASLKRKHTKFNASRKAQDLIQGDYRIY